MELPVVVGRVLRNLKHRILDIIERPFACHHMKHCQTIGVDIRSFVISSTIAMHFRCSVDRMKCRTECVLSEAAGNAEITELECQSVAGEQNVVGFDVVMNNALVVHMLKSPSELLTPENHVTNVVNTIGRVND